MGFVRYVVTFEVQHAIYASAAATRTSEADMTDDKVVFAVPIVDTADSTLEEKCGFEGRCAPGV